MQPDQWSEAARLIHRSMNAWYDAHFGKPIFQNTETDALLFCEIYETLDPGCCNIAVDTRVDRIAGLCFTHPRETHISIGIMAVDPDYYGRGIASAILRQITEDAIRRSLPVRLVSSAMNLDSFSLYNRAGFVPRAVYQDMTIDVPEEGLSIDLPEQGRIREATIDDVPEIAALETELCGIRREKDFRYIILNKRGTWHASVMKDSDGRIAGFLASIYDTGRKMLGPGVMRNASLATALIATELNHHKGKRLGWLVPCQYTELVQAMYNLGAKNCELSLVQCLGEWSAPTGVVIPTFMPETG